MYYLICLIYLGLSSSKLISHVFKNDSTTKICWKQRGIIFQFTSHLPPKMCEHELCPLLIFESCALGGTFYMSSISLFTSNYHAKPPIHQDVNRITLVDLLKFHWSKVDMNNEKKPLSLNYSCLIVILTMAYYNPHISGYSIIPNKSPNQPGALLFHCSHPTNPPGMAPQLPIRIVGRGQKPWPIGGRSF